jgi:hypothetical protein
MITLPRLFTELTAAMVKNTNALFDFAVVDKGQDVSIPQLEFLAAMGDARPNGLFFAGNLG